MKKLKALFETDRSDTRGDEAASDVTLFIRLVTSLLCSNLIGCGLRFCLTSQIFTFRQKVLVVALPFCHQFYRIWR